MDEQPEKPEKRLLCRRLFVDIAPPGVFGEKATVPAKPPRRVVSKEEYAVLVSKREAKRWGSIVLTPAIAFCFVCSFVGVLETIASVCAGSTSFVLRFLVAVVSGLGGWGLKRVAEKALQEATAPLNVVPLTRANTVGLPAADILVRASQEPAQQAELLRAAQFRREARAEQLLRAAPENPHSEDV